jgi:vacuolar-type H+-ATPase subunit B/Vma2
LAAQVAHKASLVQLKDTQNANEENCAIVCGTMGKNMEKACFFYSTFVRAG